MNAAAAALVVLNGRQAFNPRASLFAHNEPGFWYDPSDLSSMYQDSAGTTPVTAVEQAVGLILDKIKGLALGDDIKSAGAVGLIGTATAATYNTSTGVGTATRVDASNQSYVEWSGLLPAGRFYAVKIQNTGANQLYVRQAIGGTIIATLAAGADVTVYAPSSGTGTITIAAASSGTTASFTIQSFRSFAGNHAIQPTSASRPTLRARYNFATNTVFSGAVSGTPGTAPTSWTRFLSDGTSTVSGETMRLNVSAGRHIFGQAASVVANSSYKWRMQIIVHSQTGLVVGGISNVTDFPAGASLTNFQLNGSVVSSGAILSAGTYTLDVNIAIGATAGTVGLRWGVGVSGSTTADVTFSGFDFRSQVDSNLSIPSYQRVTTATDYDIVGFPLYLAFDGSDDSLYTSSIDFSATDKMTVFAGVTKLSDGAQGAVAELSATIASNNGSFLLSAPNSVSANYNWSSKGTTQVDNTVTTYTAPLTSVLTGQGDIAAPLNVIRVDGVQAGSVVTTQGTGNYGNYSLYIGRRNNATIPLNGRIYSLIVRGAITSAALIQQAERWVASKQGRTL